MRRRVFAVALASLSLAGCKVGADRIPVNAISGTAALRDVSSSDLERLSRARIFFGHQSVGYNLMDGVKDVAAADPRVKLRVVESRDVRAAEGGALLHASIGRNVHPDEKDADFLAVLDAGFGSAGDIAFYKYCYVDIQPTTDVAALFAAYKRSYEAARVKHPGLTIVHVTMPLMVSESALRSRWNLWRVGYSQRVLNEARNDFNRRLLAEYGSTGLVFDLAREESTRPDGSREFFRKGNDTVYSLVPDFTDDGGHLHARARVPVAEQLIAFLARVNATRASAAPVLAAATNIPARH